MIGNRKPELLYGIDLDKFTKKFFRKIKTSKFENPLADFFEILKMIKMMFNPPEVGNRPEANFSKKCGW